MLPNVTHVDLGQAAQFISGWGKMVLLFVDRPGFISSQRCNQKRHALLSTHAGYTVRSSTHRIE